MLSPGKSVLDVAPFSPLSAYALPADTGLVHPTVLINGEPAGTRELNNARVIAEQAASCGVPLDPGACPPFRKWTWDGPIEWAFPPKVMEH